MADTKLTSLPTATDAPNNDARIYIVDDLASSTATSLQTEFQDFQRLRYSTATATGDYTLALADNYKILLSNSTASHSITVDTTLAWPQGSWVHIIQLATGQVSVTTTSTASGILNTPASTNARTQNSFISLVSIDTDQWILSGDLEPI